MPDEVKMLDCPFCGGGEALISHEVGTIIQHRCEGRVDRPWIQIAAQTSERAIAAWNTRAQPSTLPEGWREKVIEIIHQRDEYEKHKPGYFGAAEAADAIAAVLGSVACSAEPSLASRVSDNGPAMPSGVRVSAPHLRPGPWRYDGVCKVWAPSLKGGETPVCDIRGWGYLTGGGHGALGLPEDMAIAVQNAWGQLIADAVNARFAALEGVAGSSASDGEGETGEASKPTEHKDSPTPSEKKP